MTSKQIQDIILRTLKHGGAAEVTHDQLLALCNAGNGAIGPITTRALRCELGTLVDGGSIEHAWDTSVWMWRYRMPSDRYRVRSVLDAWHVERLHPVIADHWHSIMNATESEALTCVTALNRFATKLANQIAEYKTREIKRKARLAREA